MIPEPTIAWLTRALGGRAFDIDAEPLPETSHMNHRVHVEGQVELLLRRFTSQAERNDAWFVARDEVAALDALDGRGLPVPSLVAADAEGVECDSPTLLVTWLPGRAAWPGVPCERDAFVRGLAEPLPAIHRCPPVPRRYEPYFVSDGMTFAELRPPRWTSQPSLWERVFDAAVTGTAPVEGRFIHRDYHQGNTLWIRDRLTGIVDWTTGCTGPIAIDLAHMRMNLTWDVDLELADAFLDAWRAVADDPEVHHPYWEVVDAVDWLGDGEHREEHTPERLARFEAYTARALAELG